MISLSYAVAMTAVGILFGGAVAWGVIRTTVDHLNLAVGSMSKDIVALNAIVAELKTEVAVLRERIHHNTGSHAIHPTKKSHPDKE